jgi:archaellum biogenesis ATPase FlaH
LVVIAEITDLAMICQDRTIMGFFSIFKELCTGGRAIVVVVQSGAFAPDLLGRLHQLCDTHITMAVRDKQVKVLNAGKVNNLEQRKDNGFSFRIEPGEGAKVVPMFQVRI